MGKPYVFSSIIQQWTYNISPHSWENQITVTIYQAQVLWICTFSLALFITQARTWVIIKHVINYISPLSLAILPTNEQQPAQPQHDGAIRRLRTLIGLIVPFLSSDLPGEGNDFLPPQNNHAAAVQVSIPLRDLTEHHAVVGLLHRVQSFGRRQPYGSRNLWPYGLSAIFNFFFWILVGGIMPLWLSHWPEETALVLSRSSGVCRIIEDQSVNSINIAHIADSFYRQCWLNQTHISQTPFCGTAPIVQDKPNTAFIQTQECPWKGEFGDLCRADNDSVIISHDYLFARDVGVNSDAQISMSHRLMCSPLELDSFVEYDDDEGYSVQLSDPNEGYGLIWKDYLETPNGRNHWSEEWSGHDAFMDLYVDWDLVRFPKMKRRGKNGWFIPELALGKRLQFKELSSETGSHATMFVLGYVAGHTWFGDQIRDPMFGAHFKDEEDVLGYLPDFEMTAITCAEQFRVFEHKKGPPVPLTPWVSEFNFTDTKFWKHENNNLLKDHRILITSMAQYTSVYNHIYERQGVQILMASMDKSGDKLTNVDPEKQWILELVSWMEIGIVKARYSYLQMVTGKDKTKDVANPATDDTGLRDNSTRPICGQVLIHDGDFTNIRGGWLGVWMPIVGQVLLWILSLRSIRRVVGRTCDWTASCFRRREVLEGQREDRPRRVAGQMQHEGLHEAPRREDEAQRSTSSLATSNPEATGSDYIGKNSNESQDSAISSITEVRNENAEETEDTEAISLGEPECETEEVEHPENGNENVKSYRRRSLHDGRTYIPR